jgi:hypothetical protein
MQDVNGFLELGDVHHAVNTACLPDANFPRARAYFVERLPVGRLKPGLDLPQLEVRFLSGVFWECRQIVVGGPYPTDLFLFVHGIPMYKMLYALAVLVKMLWEPRSSGGHLTPVRFGPGAELEGNVPGGPRIGSPQMRSYNFFSADSESTPGARDGFELDRAIIGRPKGSRRFPVVVVLLLQGSRRSSFVNGRELYGERRHFERLGQPRL